MKIALLVPHIFFHQDIISDVIFSPGELALSLAEGLSEQGHQITIFSPGPIVNLLPKNSSIKNITGDLSFFKQELKARGDNYIDLLKKHPLTFITLARQVQTELVVKAYKMANKGFFDLVHVWCNEEEQALVMTQFCQKPVIFNHHEPFNFLARYRAIFPKYPHLNWVSFSQAQRKTFGLPESKVNWAGTVYHGLKKDQYKLEASAGDYLLYAGRIIKPKGVHYAIEMAKKLGMKLKIAGKHYAGHSKDQYWQGFIEPEIDGKQIEFVGFVKNIKQKQELFGKARALLMPSTWQEPFGLVMIEALACGTPVIGFDQGAIPEIVQDGVTGFVVEYLAEKRVKKADKLVEQNWLELKKDQSFKKNVERLAKAILSLELVNRASCRSEFEQRFTVDKMAESYEKIYQQLIS